jgi:hypothetical protein
MTYTSAQVKEERKGSAEEQDLADPGRDCALDNDIGMRSCRSRYQPDYKDNSAGAEDDAGDSVEDR